MPRDKKLYKYEMPLDGKLITGQDPSKIGPNYQTLVNMRYHKNTIRGIGGMSKINTNALSTYLKVRSAHHFKKDSPAESHVLAEAWNAGESAARIWQNTTAIGSDGDFSGTALYTPTSTTPGGVFSDAPDGDCAYCNGSESLIWGGAEREIAGFINVAGNDVYDFTEEMRNTKSTSGNTAPLEAGSGGIDANTMLMLHLENNVTDSSPTTPHTVSNNNVTFTSSTSMMGSYYANFTTNAYLSASDNADFDLSGGVFTLDFWINVTANAADYSVYYQNTTNDDDSFNVLIDTNGAIVVRIKAGGTKQFDGETDFQTANGLIAPTWTLSPTHVEIVENGNSWYIFVDGELKAYTSDDARAANYTGDVLIGYDGSNYLEAKLDEYRLSNSARHTSEFEPPSDEYTTGTAEIDFYVASIRPLDGLKLYVSTANASASTMTGFYWNGYVWTEVSSLSDGTSASGKSLAQTGSVTFTSTESTAKLKYFEGVLAYWYKFNISASSNSPVLYYATVSAPMQSVKDIWDGEPRPIDSFQKYNGSYTDATLNVRENEYNSGNTGTLADLDSLTATTHWIVCGFVEKMSGVTFYFVNGKENTTPSTACMVEYWDGSDWKTVGAIDDGTVSNNVSFGKNGSITWHPPSSEYRQTINPTRSAPVKDISAVYLKKGKKIKYLKYFKQAALNDARLYYYRFKFSQNLDEEVELYHVSGIPAQTEIGDYSFPMLASNRLWLLCDQSGKRNTAICSADSTSSVFNGEDSYFFEFGGESKLTGGAWLNSYIGNNVYNIILFFKANETWALFGDSPDDWIQTKRRISASVGCIAPHTIRVVDIIDSEGRSQSVVVWQGQDGIYMSNGQTPIRLSEDISDNFDPRGGRSASTSEGVNSVGMWDGYHKCYHWMFSPSGQTDHTKELVFDFRKPGWFEISRGSGNILQYGIQVSDTSGVQYNYGFIDTGYMLQLEDGTDMNGSSIAQYFRTGDMVLLEGSITTETQIEHLCLVTTAKSNTDQNITLRHFLDGSSSYSYWTQSPLKSGYNIAYPVYHQDQKGSGVFHSIYVYLTTDDETIGLEPQYMYILYSVTRDHLRDWR